MASPSLHGLIIELPAAAIVETFVNTGTSTWSVTEDDSSEKVSSSGSNQQTFSVDATAESLVNSGTATFTNVDVSFHTDSEEFANAATSTQGNNDEDEHLHSASRSQSMAEAIAESVGSSQQSDQTVDVFFESSGASATSTQTLLEKIAEGPTNVGTGNAGAPARSSVRVANRASNALTFDTSLLTHGDIEIVLVGVASAAEPTTVPSGWRLLGKALTANGRSLLLIYYKFVSPTEPATAVWRWSGGAQILSGVLVTYTNALLGQSAVQADETVSAFHSTPDTIGADVNAATLAVFFAYQPSTWTLVSGMTMLADVTVFTIQNALAVQEEFEQFGGKVSAKTSRGGRLGGYSDSADVAALAISGINTLIEGWDLLTNEALCSPSLASAEMEEPRNVGAASQTIEEFPEDIRVVATGTPRLSELIAEILTTTQVSTQIADESDYLTSVALSTQILDEFMLNGGFSETLTNSGTSSQSLLEDADILTSAALASQTLNENSEQATNQGTATQTILEDFLPNILTNVGVNIPSLLEETIQVGISLDRVRFQAYEDNAESAGQSSGLAGAVGGNTDSPLVGASSAHDILETILP